jgi:hypothetical protein
MGILVVLIALAVMGVVLYQQGNRKANQSNILYPFSSVIQPGAATAPLTNVLGNPQIDCSAVGGTINIVGAWTEVTDAFSECAGTSVGVLNLSCGLPGGNKISCSQNSDCGSGMTCAGGVCQPASCPLTNSPKAGDFDSSQCFCGGTYCPIQPDTQCTTNTDCNDPNGVLMTCNNPNNTTNGGTCIVNPGQSCTAPDPFVGQFCAIYPLSSNVVTPSKGGNVVNKICDPANTITVCRPRDSSAYLAAKCNGQTTCNVTFDPDNAARGFGPAPCRATSDDISKLPQILGQGGNFNQGYYVHGLYTCILPN